MTLKQILSLACMALASIAVLAAPIPISDLGIAQDVATNNTSAWHPYPILTGGGFLGMINLDSTMLFCVDKENHISKGDTYDANVIALGAWTSGMNGLVRKGTLSSWGDGGSLTPLQRYQAAAWLVEGYSGGPAATAADEGRQNAVWRLLNGSSSGIPASNSYYTSAVSFISDPGNAGFGFGKWAVVSGSVNSDGQFIDPSHQTFLVQVERRDEEKTPEPAAYATLGAGLIGLWAFRRRASK